MNHVAQYIYLFHTHNDNNCELTQIQYFFYYKLSRRKKLHLFPFIYFESRLQKRFNVENFKRHNCMKYKVCL